ncbi:MAG: T9SS type A sorting domain-containing protein [Flavobacterium sp.]|nr:T9SS type A sorting domain-containing protein [Candidatus Neoflavobacterium equi]
MKKIYSLCAFLAFSAISFAQTSTTSNYTFANITTFGTNDIVISNTPLAIEANKLTLTGEKNTPSAPPKYFGANASNRDLRVYNETGGNGNQIQLNLIDADTTLFISQVNFTALNGRNPALKYSIDGGITFENVTKVDLDYSIVSLNTRSIIIKNAATATSSQLRILGVSVTYTKPAEAPVDPAPTDPTDPTDPTVPPTASVNENGITGLNIYPNPANNVINIASDLAGLKTVVIYNIAGKQVINTTTEQTVNVANLNAGIYMVKVSQEGKTATRKLVIK